MEQIEWGDGGLVVWSGLAVWSGLVVQLGMMMWSESVVRLGSLCIGDGKEDSRSDYSSSAGVGVVHCTSLSSESAAAFMRVRRVGDENVNSKPMLSVEKLCKWMRPFNCSEVSYLLLT